MIKSDIDRKAEKDFDAIKNEKGKPSPQKNRELDPGDEKRYELASKVTTMLITIIYFNTIMTAGFMAAVGSGIFHFSTVDAVTFLISTMGSIGFTTLIIRLLPDNKQQK